MKGQKEALVEHIKNFGFILPTKVNLTVAQFESIANILVDEIRTDQVSYGKDKNDSYEVRRYVRSMIKNHLNKAVELNGGIRKGGTLKPALAPKQTGPALSRAELPKELLAALDEYTGETDGAGQ